MRRIVYAASFVDDADRIAAYIETKFGADRADLFIAELNRFCQNVATQPGLGRANHGYRTPLLGIVYDRNWIFFNHDDAEIRFLHMVEGMRRKAGIRF